MKGNLKNITKVALLAIVIFFIYFVIKNYSLVENKDSQVAPINNKVLESATSTNNPAQVNEDDDVYGQRQLRADFNNGSSTGGY